MIRLNPDRIAEQKIQQLMNARNNRPDPEMGGLSPNQVYRLFSLIQESFYRHFWSLKTKIPLQQREISTENL